jgi:CRISPR-associated protein Cmr3
MVLATPGIFEKGWLPTGVVEVSAEHRFQAPGLRGRLVAAAVPRAEIISGWDLAKEQPKPAQRVAPAGSVYWLDELETTAADLRRLVDAGLWTAPCEDPQRRAEGFNRLWLAQWAQEKEISDV